MPFRLNRLLALIAMLVTLMFGVSAQPPLPLPGGTPVHALTLTVDAGGVVSVAGYTPTIVRETLTSDPIERYVQAVQTMEDTEYDLVAVQLIDDASGAVVYRTTVTVARWIRSEHAVDPDNLSVAGANGSNIQGARIPWLERTFSVKVPVIPGANRLDVALPSATRGSNLIDLKAAAAQFGTRGTRDVTLIPLDGYDNGDPANRLDIVILGDGYTSAEQATFEADAQALADGLFVFAPYSTYKEYFNVVGVFGASNQSGADQPSSCTDPNPPVMNGQFKDTRYNSTYCYDGIARLLVATNYTQIYADADAGYPNWDEIFVVVNDFTYGGSGGAIATVSKTSTAAQMLQHEAGHSIVRLDDEYSTSEDYPPCSDKGRSGITTPCQPNVTDQTTRALIKWSRWISPGAPQDPTTKQISAEPGLWLGAHYQSDTYFRPCQNCAMRSLGQPFGQVQSEQLPIVLYGGGWEGQGSYWEMLSDGTGIDIIELGSAAPDPLAGTITIPSAASQVFSVTVMSPGNEPGTRVRWKVNGTLMQDSTYGHGETATYEFTPISADTYTVVAEVTENAGVLHSTQTGVSKSTRTWTVEAEGYTGAGTELLVNRSFETPKPGNSKQPDAWTATSVAKSKLKCNTETLTVAYAGDSGVCAYLMQGVSGTTATLKQKPAPIGDAGDAFIVSGWFDTQNLTASFSVLVKFTVAGVDHKVKLQQLERDQPKTAPYFRLENIFVLGIDSADVTKINVQVKFPNAGGKVYVDALSLLHYDEYLTSPPPPGGRLGLPEFRGMN